MSNTDKELYIQLYNNDDNIFMLAIITNNAE